MHNAFTRGNQAGEPPSLSESQVHIWKASILHEESGISHFLSLLSSDERERSARFLFRRDRNRFVVSRGILRMILARYLKTPPDGIVLLYDVNGKPRLSPDQNPGGLSFNLAHSADRAVYAFAKHVQVGIDIEQWRDDVPVQELAERFFSPHERSALRSLPDHERRAAFFRCWTRKEAYLKALGQGLSAPLEGFTVSVKPDESPILLEALATDNPSHWTLLDLHSGVGFTTALAVRLERPHVVFWEFGS